MKFKWDEPMNPNATGDFAKAVREASAKFGDDLKKMGEQIKAEMPFMDEPYVAFEDFYPEEDYSGVMRLKYDGVFDIYEVIEKLIENGYEVTVRLEDATETEKELDGADKFVVIEYEEVE